MNQIVPDEYPVDYSLVIVGPFDQLDFINNPSELHPISSKSCSSKCASNKCNSETSTCICDKLHTGTNCEFEITEIVENKPMKHSMTNREFWFTHLDLSNYIKSKELNQLILTIQTKCDNYVYSNGFVRFFINTDNKVPLTMPNNYVQINNDVDSIINYPLSDLTEVDDLYLTIFNDYGINISFSLNWNVKKSSISLKNNENDAFNSSNKNSSKFSQTKTFKILMLALIVAGCVAIISILVLLIVKIIKKKRSMQIININNILMLVLIIN